jgi:hypothetical protein
MDRNIPIVRWQKMLMDSLTHVLFLIKNFEQTNENAIDIRNKND